MGFPHSSVGKESACNAGDRSLIPGLGRSPGEGIGYPLQYSWASLVAQPVKNPPVMWETWVDPWVGTIPWRRERLPTPVFWPGEFHELYSPWGLKESDTTEWLSLSLTLNMSWCYAPCPSRRVIHGRAATDIFQSLFSKNSLCNIFSGPPQKVLDTRCER